MGFVKSALESKLCVLNELYTFVVKKEQLVVEICF